MSIFNVTNTTCITCGRGAYEGLHDGKDAIICCNCGKEEHHCDCKPLKAMTKRKKKYYDLIKNK